MAERTCTWRRWLWVGSCVLLAAWLAPAVFVALYEPGSAEAPPLDELDPAHVLASLSGERDPGFFLFSHGYAKHWSVTTWEGDAEEPPPDAFHSRYHVERGALDREAARFPLFVAVSSSDASDLDVVRLYVTSEPGGDERSERAWTLVEEVQVRSVGAEPAVVLLRADVEASSVALRVEEIGGGEPSGGFSTPMPTAPTFFGRLYDRLAWRDAFRWIPDLR